MSPGLATHASACSGSAAMTCGSSSRERTVRLCRPDLRKASGFPAPFRTSFSSAQAGRLSLPACAEEVSQDTQPTERRSLSAHQAAQPQAVADSIEGNLDKLGSRPVPTQSRSAHTLSANKARRMCSAYTAAVAACFPRPTMATRRTPMTEPTATVQPIHKVIWGRIPA